jgi:hypothetical protein
MNRKRVFEADLDARLADLVSAASSRMPQAELIEQYADLEALWGLAGEPDGLLGGEG